MTAFEVARQVAHFPTKAGQPSGQGRTMGDGRGRWVRAQYSITVEERVVAEDVDLDRRDRTVVGRGRQLPDERWIPKQLVVMEPARGGWLLDVHRGPARLRGESMTGTVDEGAQLHFGPGTHRLEWTLLKHRVSLTVDVAFSRRPPAWDRSRATSLTSYPRARRHVRDDERRRFAIAFRYLLESQPKRKDHWAKAGAELGMTGDELRRWLHKRRERLQRELAADGRPTTFHELDDYGRWLVTDGRLKVSDLPPAD